MINLCNQLTEMWVTATILDICTLIVGLLWVLFVMLSSITPIYMPAWKYGANYPRITNNMTINFMNNTLINTIIYVYVQPLKPQLCSRTLYVSVNRWFGDGVRTRDPLSVKQQVQVLRTWLWTNTRQTPTSQSYMIMWATHIQATRAMSIIQLGHMALMIRVCHNNNYTY